MCLVQYQHFSLHDVRPLMAARPVAAVGSGDFVDPLTVTHCRCDYTATIPITDEERRLLEDGFELPDVRRWVGCRHHDCCANWVHRTPCDWALSAFNPDPDHPYPEDFCPNAVTAHEYYPIQLAMCPCSNLQGQSEPLWQADIPTFPVDMIYSPRLRYHEGSYSSARDCRMELVASGKALWRLREELQNVVNRAKVDLIIANQRVREVRSLTAAAEITLAAITTVTPTIREAGQIKFNEVRASRDFLLSLRDMLSELGGLPHVGHAAWSSDGTYSCSRELLDAALADDRDMLTTGDIDVDQLPAMVAFLEEYLRQGQTTLGQWPGRGEADELPSMEFGP